MNISKFEKCANCGMCVSLCPKQAIAVNGDGMFYRPSVNNELCVDCGLCAERCPVSLELAETKPVAAFYSVHKDKSVVRKSSSGGFFSAVAEHVISQGGAVFGAAYSPGCDKVLFSSTDEAELDELRRSKYTESLTGDVFVRIKKCLDSGRRALFCGTPCQVAGLKSFLNREDELLLTCDFICGGLPSHKIYNDYLSALEKKYKSKVTSVNFRPKTFGWREYAVKITFENGKEYVKQAELDPFFSAFVRHRWTVRDLCVSCPFATRRSADFTLSDFWRCRSVTGEQDSDEGVSLIFVNTQKGVETARQLEALTKMHDIPLEKVEYAQKPHGVPKNYRSEREAFLREYEQNGIMAAGSKLSVSKGKTALKAKLRGIQRKQKR